MYVFVLSVCCCFLYFMQMCWSYFGRDVESLKPARCHPDQSYYNWIWTGRELFHSWFSCTLTVQLFKVEGIRNNVRWDELRKKWNESSLLRYCSVFCWHRGQRRTKHTERVSGSSDALLKLKTKWEQTIMNSDAPMLCPGNNIFGWILCCFEPF